MNNKKDLIERLKLSRRLKNSKIIEAFNKIDRADFVINEYKDQAYVDSALPIYAGQTISQPSTVAFMLELLNPEPGNKILDVGSGSGWTTVLLAYIAGEKGSVVGLELIEELVEFGRDNLSQYGFSNAEIRKAEERELGILGKEFDRILVSAAAKTIPNSLIKQIKPGGRMVIPVKNSVYEVIKEKDGNIQKNEHYGFSFVPLIENKNY